MCIMSGVTLLIMGRKLSQRFSSANIENLDSFVEINEFSETTQKRHLLISKNVFSKNQKWNKTPSMNAVTAIRFVFQKYFYLVSALWLMSGRSAPAEAYIYYNSEGAPWERQYDSDSMDRCTNHSDVPPYSSILSQWYVQTLVWCTS